MSILRNPWCWSKCFWLLPSGHRKATYTNREWIWGVLAPLVSVLICVIKNLGRTKTVSFLPFTSSLPLPPVPAFVLCSAIIFTAALSWAESLLCHPLWAEQVKVLPSSDWVLLLLLPVGTQWMLAGQRVVWICSWHISMLYGGTDAQTEWSDPTPGGKWGLKNCCCLMGNFSKCVLRQFFHYLQFPLVLYSEA